MTTTLKAYDIFVDSERGARLEINEQAPSGGVVRVSLKSLLVPRMFGNLPLASRQVFYMGVTAAGAVIDAGFVAANLSLVTLPDAIYTSREQIAAAVLDAAKQTILTYDGTATFAPGDGDATVITSLMVSRSDALYITPGPASDLVVGFVPTEADASMQIIPASFTLAPAMSCVYLRSDAHHNNLETELLAGHDGIPGESLHHSDILGCVPLTRGEGPHRWQAQVAGEMSFDAHSSLQGLELRLTDHLNRPLDAPFACVLGVQLVILRNIGTLGLGAAPNPTDPKDSNILKPLW